LTDLSPQALVATIWNNAFGWWRYMGTSPGAEFHDSPELTWLLTGLPSAFVNPVLRTRAEPGNLDALIGRTLAHFRSRDVTKFAWFIGPDTQPANLGVHLAHHGLTYSEDPPGMAVDLVELNEDHPAPDGLTIEPALDGRALEKWAYASIVGFGLPEPKVKGWFELFAALGFDLPLRSYLGTLDGEPVATSQLFLGAGVAGIYVVATVPEARGQGIGAALTLAPLRDARALGYRAGILHASPMGLGVYRRLGFREYCRMNHYQHQVREPGSAAGTGRTRS